MNINFIIALTSLVTSSLAVLVGLRYYSRFGRSMEHWGWLVMTVSSISLAASEFIDAYATFHGGGLAELSDIFAILAEIFLAVGLMRLFDRELVKDKIHEQNLKINLVKTQDLLSAALQVTSSLNLEETLHTLLDRAIALTGADLAAIYLSEHSGRLAGKYIGVRHKSNQVVTSERELGSLTQQILSTGRPILIENLQDKDKNLVSNTPGKLTAMGGFPLREKGEILGVMFVGFEQTHSFGNDQQLLLMSIADHGALALRNAALYEQVEDLSLTDSLTGLANRRHFDQTLAMELARARRYNELIALVILDIDLFKNINDTFGHPAGDAALKKIAEILRENIRLSDLAARIGGEEMALVLPQSDLYQAALLAERLRACIQQTPILWEGKVMRLTCSFGVSGGKGAALPESSTEIYQHADQALYDAKKGGRNRVVMM